MSEPQDHRLNLPWQSLGGHLLAIPQEPGALHIGVTTEALSPPALAEYIATLHNDALHARAQLPGDASSAADAYVHEHVPPTVGAEQVGSWRQIYVDGYKEGWKEGIQVHRDDAVNDQKAIASLRAQVEAAYARAEHQQERTEELLAGNHELRKQLADTTENFQAASGELSDLRASFNQSQRDVQTYRGLADQGAQDVARLKKRVEKLEDVSESLDAELSDIRDDVRIAFSRRSGPGAVDAAAKRLFERVNTIPLSLTEDSAEAFVAELNASPLVVFAARGNDKTATQKEREFEELVSDPPGSELLPDGYDKAAVVHGVGHHSPSYAEGYRIGWSDVAKAFGEPMEQRDQALYAAHLLLTESVAAHEATKYPWQRAVRRWQDEYVRVFGTPEEDS